MFVRLTHHDVRFLKSKTGISFAFQDFLFAPGFPPRFRDFLSVSKIPAYPPLIVVDIFIPTECTQVAHKHRDVDKDVYLSLSLSLPLPFLNEMRS